MAKQAAPKTKKSADGYIAKILDIKCPNCKFVTTRALISHCPQCGYPEITKTKCPGCGNYTDAGSGACPECGYKTATVQAAATETVTRPAPEAVAPQPEPVSQTPATPEPVVIPDAPAAVVPVVEEIKPVAAAAPEHEAEDAPIVNLIPEIRPERVAEPVEKKPAPPRIFPDEEVLVSADELTESFVRDSVAATANYAEKYVRVKGTVEKVDASNPERPVMILGSPEAFVLQKVECVFDTKYATVLGRLAAGQRIVVLGKFKTFETNVVLVDCIPVG